MYTTLLTEYTVFKLFLQEKHEDPGVQDLHSSSDEEIVQQDSRFDYYTMPSTIPNPTDDIELAGNEIIMI